MIDKKNIEKLPEDPGVYFFKNNEEILYIGKATNLKDRIRSYFSLDIIESRGPKIVKMLELANNIDYIKTDSVLEALILESKLIKKNAPDFNTKEKDNKSHNYIAITKEDFPRVFVIRQRDIEKSSMVDKIPEFELYGPFPHPSILREALKILRKIFPFRDLKSQNKYYDNFYKQLKLSPDIEKDSALLEYKQTIKDLKLFLNGDKKRLITDLEKRMKSYSKKLKFEEAGRIKKTIFSLKHIHDIALIKDELIDDKKGKIERVEAYDIAHMSGKNTVGVMVVFTDNEKDLAQYRKFKIKTETNSSDTGALLELLERRFSHEDWRLPNLIVGDGGLIQKRLIERFLKTKNLTIPVVTVVKNEKHQPKGLLGSKKFTEKKELLILQINAEAHRFAIEYFRLVQRKNSLN